MLSRTLARAVSTCGLLVAQAFAQSANSVAVSPNVLVSREGDIPHIELTLAAHPTERNLLLGAAIAAREQGSWTSRAYISRDGGNSWSMVTPPQPVGVDPQVAFAPGGTAYFAALGSGKDKDGKTRSGIAFFSTRDAGVTWSGPTVAGMGPDHPQIVVDHTHGPFAGRIYIAYLYGTGDSIIGVTRSDDEGKTFSDPVRAAVSGPGAGVNVNTPLVLSDGTLIVPCIEFLNDPMHTVMASVNRFYVVSSSDGGTTFSAPYRVEDRHVQIELRIPTFPVFAADSSGGPYHDRIYTAWTDWRSGKARIWFSSSADKGRTWSNAIAVDLAATPESLQYQPAMAVNSKGIVGVAWFDTREASDVNHYDEYFTASFDGGATFTKPVRVSTATSNMLGPGNVQPRPQLMRMGTGLQLVMLSAANRWRQGGEYMGLTSDEEGTFHPFWSDARSGTSQVWTARISTGTQLSMSALAQSTDISGRVAVLFDPATYDDAAAELRLPVRVKNMSDRLIGAPLVVSIKQFGSGMGDDLRDVEFAPEILNATNQQKGAGAAYDYSSAMSQTGLLEPGAQTDAIVWRLRFPNRMRIPDLHLQVSGRTEPAVPATTMQH